MPVTLECPHCHRKFETTMVRGEKGEFGYLKNTIGDDIGRLYLDGLTKDEVAMKFYSKDKKLHTGRINRVFSELNQQEEFKNKRNARLQQLGKLKPQTDKKGSDKKEDQKDGQKDGHKEPEKQPA